MFGPTLIGPTARELKPVGYILGASKPLMVEPAGFESLGILAAPLLFSKPDPIAHPPLNRAINHAEHWAECFPLPEGPSLRKYQPNL